MDVSRIGSIWIFYNHFSAFCLDLQVVFECNAMNPPWLKVIDDLTITDRIVSFKTPLFPYQFDQAVQVNVILRQTSRDIGTLTYFYLPTCN